MGVLHRRDIVHPDAAAAAAAAVAALHAPTRRSRGQVEKALHMATAEAVQAFPWEVFREEQAARDAEAKAALKRRPSQPTDPRQPLMGLKRRDSAPEARESEQASSLEKQKSSQPPQHAATRESEQEAGGFEGTQNEDAEDDVEARHAVATPSGKRPKVGIWSRLLSMGRTAAVDPSSADAETAEPALDEDGQRRRT